MDRKRRQTRKVRNEEGRESSVIGLKNEDLEEESKTRRATKSKMLELAMRSEEVIYIQK